MPSDVSRLLRAMGTELAVETLTLDELRIRQLQTVISQWATGTGNIANTFELDRKFRLVFIRCHFTGTSGTAPLDLSIESANGTAYNTKLFSVTQAGVGQDVHLRIGDGDTHEPSAWTFQTGDKIRMDWTNPDSGNITWGMEVGMVLAS